jgi:hypothetical protein
MKLVRTALVALTALPLGWLTSCASVMPATLETEMQTLLAGQRPRPPSAERNKVYLVFQDQTGESVDFQKSVQAKIRKNVEEAGYKLANSDKADYVLWATLRIFTKTGTEEGNRKLAALGGIVGGAAVGTVAADATDSATVGWVSGIATGAGTAYAIEKLTEKDHWAMVVDLQLASRVDEEIRKTIRTEDQKRLFQLSAAAIQGAASNLDVGGSATAQTASSERVETTFFAELEQRLAASASSRGKSKAEVAEAMADRLANGIANQLPPLYPEDQASS